MHSQTIEDVVREIVRAEITQVLPTMLLNPNEEYLSTREVADLTGMSVAFFEGRRSAESPDQPPYQRIGRRVIYKRSEVETWLSSRTRGASNG